MAAAKPLEREKCAAPDAVLIDRLPGVFRAAGVISAALREKRGKNSLVELDAP
jgi:hypothetical protein